MKKILSVCLLGFVCLVCSMPSQAIDFKVKGQWWMGFTLWNDSFTHSTRRSGNKSKSANDHFDATQRIRLQLEAAASESLSGTVQIQMGGTAWGQARSGGALGADGKIVKVRQAYLDFMPPNFALKTRMGIHFLTLPNAAGGPAVLDERMAGISASWEINENISVSGFWGRPFNDNYDGDGGYQVNYLDNMDLFALILPIRFDSFSISPWFMYGFQGKNTFGSANADNQFWMAGNPLYTLRPYPAAMSGNLDFPYGKGTSRAWGNMFWAGLPVIWTDLAPWNIEFDINYGFVESMGRYTATRYSGANYDIAELKRCSTRREGWLAKALVEYRMDWGIPGIFGWYSSGDDSNPKNGSERMPSVVSWGNFTSFMGDGNLGWKWQDLNVSYAGTWGIGIQLRNMSFVEDLTHTFRVTWWGGTNSPAMVRYMDAAYAWENASEGFNGPYMTTNDAMLEFNMVNIWQMYENFDVNLELGYIANYMDNDTWKKAGRRDSSFDRQDRYKVQLAFCYNF